MDRDSLSDLIEQAQVDACENVARVILECIVRSGFTYSIFFNGVAGAVCTESEKAAWHLEQAALALENVKAIATARTNTP